MSKFQDYILQKEAVDPENWKNTYHTLEKGFIPPTKMRPVIEAFLKSGEIELSNDTKKAPTMPKKTLFLVGGPVRDHILGKTIKDYDLATNATPEQIAHILTAAGFAMLPERSGKDGEPLNLSFKPRDAKPGDKRVWFVKGRDSSPQRKPFVISAVVDGEEFEIATFRRDAKVTDGAAQVDFVDNPVEDAARRDLTMNAGYIELNSVDKENKKFLDPTEKALHDIKHGIVRTVGKATDRFGEDKIRVMRAIRFHCRFGGGATMDKDIEHAIPQFKNLNGVALERIRDEFLKGLLHPDVDPKSYIGIFMRTGLLNKVFPGVAFESPNGEPLKISDKKDKPLALAWLLQHNSAEKIEEVLSGTRRVGMEEIPTGWASQEKRAVVFLIRLKEFDAKKDPTHVAKFMRMRQGTGLSNEQIENWVSMFNREGTNQSNRPWWASQATAFANHQPSVRWDDVQKMGQDKCPNCQGKRCLDCGYTGQLPPHMRSAKIAELEGKNFLDKLEKR